MKTDIEQSRKAKNRQADDQEPCKRLTLSPPVFLHNDILTGIFPRLPLRSLIRFKCVSKEWQSLILNQRFTPPRNFNPPSGLFLQRISTDVTLSTRPEYDFVPFDSIKTPPFRTLDFHENVMNSDVMILHSSNGLMLCYSLHVSKEGEFNATYYVYNPTTKQVATLPACQDVDIRRPSDVILIFDPLKSSYYRVVFVRGHGDSKPTYSIEIYSSETRRWKIWYLTAGDKIEPELFMYGVYWNGSIHWINKKGNILFLRIDGEAGFYETEIRMPVLIDQRIIKRHCCPLVESRHRLIFMGISSIVDMRFDVHEIDKDYSCTLKYRINLNQVMVGFSDPMESFVIHCLVLGEKEEDAFIVLEVPGKAIKLNIAADTFQELFDLDSQRFKFSVANDGFSKLGRRPGAFLFFESLAHVKNELCGS